MKTKIKRVVNFCFERNVVAKKWNKNFEMIYGALGGGGASWGQSRQKGPSHNIWRAFLHSPNAKSAFRVLDNIEQNFDCFLKDCFAHAPQLYL